MWKVIVRGGGAFAVLVMGIAIGRMADGNDCWLARLPFTSNPNWTCISREANEGLLAAENAAIAVGRRELDTWHTEVMANIDRHFLDQHLSFLSNLASTGRYIWTRLISGQEQAAKEELERQKKLFQETVVSDSQLQERMEAVADRMVNAFANSLDGLLAETARRYGVSAAALDAHILSKMDLPQIATGQSQAKDALSIVSRFEFIKRRLKQAQPLIAAAMHYVGTFTGVELIHSATAKEAAGMSTKHAAHKLAAAGTKTATAKLGTIAVAKIGGLLAGGPFVLVSISGLVAWEVWGHHAETAKRKDLLSKQIGGALMAYEAALLEPKGPLGSIIRQMRSEIEPTVRGG